MSAAADANVLLTCSEIVDRLDSLPASVTTAEAPSHTDDPLLDAYLYMSALEQILGDSLHRGLYNFSNVVSYLQHSRQLIEILTLRLPPRLTRLIDLLLRTPLLPAAGAALDGMAALRARARARLVERHATDLWPRLWDTQVVLGEALARAAATGSPSTDEARLRRRIREIVEAAPELRPDVRSARLRLPSCFVMLDVLPEDCFRLGERLAAWLGDGPVMCVGVRTSGSYLGPLVAGELRHLGSGDVAYATARPHTALLGPERDRIVAACRGEHRICIIDDPPQTGRALAAMARVLLQAGARPEQIAGGCIAAGTQPGPAGPMPAEADGRWRNIWADSIADVPLICIEPEHRRISELLSDASVDELINGRHSPRDGSREPGASGTRKLAPQAEGRETTRGHRQRRLHVKAAEGVEGADCTVVAKGIGLGFFGRRAAAAAGRLGDWVPPVLATRGAIMISKAGPEGRGSRPCRPTPTEVAGYVADRVSALRMKEDPSLDLDDRACGWHKLAAELCRGYHLLGPFHAEQTARRLRRIFAPPGPAVIDACMQGHNWERLPDGSLRKRDFEEGPFGSNDILLFDPVYDLAAAAYELDFPPGQWTGLVDAYRQASGQDVGPARWYIHQLLYGSQAMNSARIMLAGMRAAAVRELEDDEVRDLDATTRRAEHFLTRATHRFLAEVYRLEPAEADGSRVFAIDIDGVLGDGRAGFTSASPAGAQALHCLVRHGWTAVLATGRSLAETACWCEDLGLQGAVAEYGSAVWDARRNEVTDLRDDEEVAAIDHARDALAECRGVFIEPTYRHGIRAYRRVRGARTGLTAEQVGNARRAAGDVALREVPGARQTDLVPATVDKSRGLQELMRRAGWQPRELWGIGDTTEDLPFLRLADNAWAPANATARVKRELRARPGGRVSGRRNQAAVLQAAAAAACGQRWPCVLCRVDVHDTEVRTVIELLAARNQPIWRAALGALNRGALAAFRCERQ